MKYFHKSQKNKNKFSLNLVNQNLAERSKK